MGAMRIGNGMDDGVTCGPMINAAAIDTIDELVQRRRRRRERRCPSADTAAKAPGYFYEPTVLDHVDADAEITGHEIFGPVAPMIRSTTPTR